MLKEIYDEFLLSASDKMKSALASVREAVSKIRSENAEISSTLESNGEVEDLTRKLEAARAQYRSSVVKNRDLRKQLQASNQQPLIPFVKKYC